MTRTFSYEDKASIEALLVGRRVIAVTQPSLADDADWHRTGVLTLDDGTTVTLTVSSGDES